jgi:hypothetical protein
VVILNTILDAITNRSEAVPDWLQLYAMFILPATPIIVGVGIAFIFLLDPSKKIHDARAAAHAASMDALALQMREAANRPDINQAIQLAAVKDMQEAAVRVTGVRIVEPTPPKLPAKIARNGGAVALKAEGRARPKLTQRSTRIRKS